MDYFDNSRRAAFAQQAVRDPESEAGLPGLPAKYCLGHLRRATGPGRVARQDQGHQRGEFFRVIAARGVPDGPDDGTLAPWAVVASLPFAPELVLPSIKHFNEAYPEMTSKYRLQVQL